MTTAAETVSPARRGFFEHNFASRIILASFPFVTVPLVAGLTLTSDHRFLLLYTWLFGLTHFVLTFSVYLQSENLRHFTSTARNTLLYCVVPLTILMGFYVIGVFQLNDKFPAFAVMFGAAIRLLDFNHLNRQTFGVYQLFKARTGVRPSPAVKRAEQGYLGCLTALLFTTFLSGGLCPLLQFRDGTVIGAFMKPGPALLPIGVLQAAFVVIGSLAVVLGGISVTLLLRSWSAAGRPAGLSSSLGYIGFQTVAALLSVVSLPLYFATLATHYVEYHVLMVPRCFHSRLDENSTVDRCFGVLRRHGALFYGVVVMAAGIALLFITQSHLPSQPIRYRLVVSIFDGLFVFHYFVEMLIWRFSDPFFRRTLTPLYISSRSAKTPVAAPSAPSGRLAMR